ncbi:MAG: polysaccharide ABC transporter ATP-binding protein [Acidobacteriota bacterium]
MSPPLIAVQGLEKTYRVYRTPWDRLRERLGGGVRHQAVHALRGIDFELGRGESLAVVGQNGAGKSTLLAILSGVTAPSAGDVRVDGRVASMLELGMGFHPELTGRQNIRLNAAMMGLGDEEVTAKMPDIVAFSELGEFLDRPIKTYSSGMKMRLGFAIAVQVEPEILIVDEALSVGDGYFQKKCMDRVRQLLDGGCTFLFCSHAMYYVTTFCREALWLRRGQAEAYGPANDVVRRYENFLVAKDGRADAAIDEAPPAEDASQAGFTAIRLLAGDGRHYRHRDAWAIACEWTSEDPSLGFQIALGIDRADGVQVLCFATHLDGREAMRGERRYRLRLDVPELPLIKGEFDLVFFLLDEKGLHVYDRQPLPSAFEIVSDDYPIGLITAEHAWRQEEPRAS